MRNPEDLKVFQAADTLVLLVYRVTNDFPANERFGLTSQLRRAVVSVASNIVEGCSRSTQADFARFVELALGSAMEARYQCTIARRLWPDVTADVTVAEEHASEVVKMLAALGKALRAET